MIGQGPEKQKESTGQADTEVCTDGPTKISFAVRAVYPPLEQTTLDELKLANSKEQFKARMKRVKNFNRCEAKHNDEKKGLLYMVYKPQHHK